MENIGIKRKTQDIVEKIKDCEYILYCATFRPVHLIMKNNVTFFASYATLLLKHIFLNSQTFLVTLPTRFACGHLMKSCFYFNNNQIEQGIS